METIIGLIIFVGGYFIYKACLNNQVDNYPVNKLDNTKLTKDVVDGVPLTERKRRMVNGYYDKDKKK